MSLAPLESLLKSRVKALLDHFSIIDDPRQQWKVAHPLAEVLLLVVCGTIYDCDTYAEIAAGARRTCRCCAAICPIMRSCQASGG